MRVVIVHPCTLSAIAIEDAVLAVVPRYTQASAAMTELERPDTELRICAIETMDRDGIDYIPQVIRPVGPRTIIVDARTDRRTLRRLRLLPFNGYIDATVANASALRDAVTEVMHGGRYLSPGLADKFQQATSRCEWDGLTGMEQLTLSLIGAGYHKNETGRRLGISPETARGHRGRLMAEPLAAKHCAAKSARTCRSRTRGRAGRSA
jgi:DNA-binding NarL/FixJ family response regulator